MKEASLEKLSLETRTKLRSTQILTSLPQVTSELLQNSLDAGARSIDVGINCEDWTCWVRDDGNGINKDELATLAQGSEQGRYNTSKSYTMGLLADASTFGFRGEALASAADLGCLEVSSRTAKSKQTWSIILKGGAALYIGPSVRWRRESPGTTVCVRDAFYNLPVRRLSHPSPVKTIELIRNEIEVYALVFPNVSFSLERSSSGVDGCEKVLKIPKTRSTLVTFKHIFGRALVEHIYEVEACAGELRLEGFISLSGAHSKSHQFLYINNHPISYCDLHRTIESRFTNSSFGKHAFDDEGETSMRSAVRRSPRKGEKKPVYVLNLIIPTRLIDNCLEPAKASVEFENKNAVLAFLSSEVQTFLIRNGFATHRPVDSSDIRESPRKRRKIMTDTQTPPREIANILSRDSANKGEPLYLPASATVDQMLWTDPTTGEAFVVDTRTGNSVSQTMMSTDSQSEGPLRRRRTLATVKSIGQPDRGLATVHRAEQELPMPPWIHNALMANDAFSLPEKQIPSFPLVLGPPIGNGEAIRKDGHCLHGCNTPFQPLSSADPSSLKFHKEDLLHVRVINQVDRKFIACVIRTTKEGSEQCHAGSGSSRDQSPEETIILIDQHAADERVRVEKFLKELCMGYFCLGEGSPDSGVRTRLLSPTALVLLTHHEARRLSSSQSIQQDFGRWGFEFSRLNTLSGTYLSEAGADASTESGYAQVEVLRLPDLVADKLLQGNELRDLIKGVLSRSNSDESGRGTECQVQEDSQVDLAWLRALRWCPRELIELVNSKACRGAIMFNDPLTIPQCEKLVHQLSQTVFPFQCAHGRPSLVPLTNVGKQTRSREPRQGTTWQWGRFEEMRVTS